MGRRISRNLRIRAQEQEPNLFGGNLLDDENDSELTNCLMDGKENLLSCLRTYLPHTHLHESSKVSSKKKKERTVEDGFKDLAAMLDSLEKDLKAVVKLMFDKKVREKWAKERKKIKYH